MLADFARYLAIYNKSQPLERRMPYLKPMLRFFYLDSTIVELLIAAKRTDILQNALQELFIRSRPKEIMIDVPQEYLDYWSVIRSNAGVSVLVHWVTRGKKEAPDALADGLLESAKKFINIEGKILL